MSSITEQTIQLVRNNSSVSSQPQTKEKKKVKKDSEKDLAIQEYFNIGVKCKEILCTYWIRGCCIFDKDTCRYAHGIKDLEYICYKDLPKDYEAPELPRSFSLNSFLVNMRYDYLILFQKNLLADGIIKPDQAFTEDELNQEGAKRNVIRNLYRRNIAEDLLSLLYKKYPDIFITRSFVEKEMNRIGLICKMSDLLEEKFFELPVQVPPRLSKRQPVILPYISDEYYAQRYINRIISLAKEFLLRGEKPPLSSSQMKKELYIDPPEDIPSN